MGLWIHNGNEHLDAVSDYRTILGVCIALPIVMTIVVGMRAYARAKILRTLGVDDWIVFFSAVSLAGDSGIWSFKMTELQICAIIYSGLCIGQSRWGLGLPLTMRPKPNLNAYSVVSESIRVQNTEAKS